MKENKIKIIKAVCLIVLILVSFFGLSRIATSPKTYSPILEKLQDKEKTVSAITTGAVVTATAIAAIPSDSTTPFANHILEISSYLMLVNCVITLEKSVMTLLGGVSTYFLIPLGLGILLLTMFKRDEDNRMKKNAFKVLAFACALLFVIPVSVWAGEMVEESNREVVNQVVADIASSNETDFTESEGGKLSSFLNSIKKGATIAGGKLEELNTKFVSAITIFIVSNCFIPIAVVAFVMWIIKILFGITIKVPKIKSPLKFKEKKESNAITSGVE